MAEIVAFVNYKGGVTKTSSVVSTAVAMAKLLADGDGDNTDSRNVLVIDFDPQNNVSMCLGYGFDEELYGEDFRLIRGLSDVLEGRVAAIDDVSYQPRPDTLGNLWIAPAGRELAEYRGGLYQLKQRETILDRFITNEMRRDYKYIFIDTPPDEGPLTSNAIFAADWVIMPVLLDGLSQSGMRRVENTIAELNKVYPENPVKLLGVLVSVKNDGERASNREQLDKLWEVYGDEIFSTSINTERQVRRALESGMTLYEWGDAKKSRTRAEATFETFVAEIEKRIANLRGK